MVVEATFTVSTDGFPLGSIWGRFPDVRMTLEKVVPIDDSAVPYFWVKDGDENEVVTAFEDHGEVKRVEFVDKVGAQCLFRCEWNSEYTGIIAGLQETNVTLLQAEGTAEEWTFHVRAETRKPIAAFQRYCHEHDIPIRLSSLSTLTPHDDNEIGVTEPQLEGLLLAYERGYFDTPREVTLAELAAELKISSQAVSSRLRRGTRRLIEKTLVETEGASGDT